MVVGKVGKAPKDSVEKERTPAMGIGRGLLCSQGAQLDQFREISLLDVEGKIFCSVIAKRLTTSLLANEYVNTSVQKGGVPGFLGCLKHTSVMSQVIKEAKTNTSTLSVVWLDLAKAFKISGTLLLHHQR